MIVIYIIGKIFYIPLKHIGKLLLNSVLGGIFLMLLNGIGSLFSFHIGLNVGTALTIGILGLPGVVLLIALQLFLG